jgi:hypothetical protein
MGIRRLVGLFAFCVVILLPCSAQDQPCPKDGRPDCPRALEFFNKVQAALKNNDREAIAGMMEYPFLTWIDHRKVHVRTRKQLLAHFDQIFDAGVRCEVLNATNDSFWGSYRGYTVGLGAIWFDDPIPPGGQMDAKAPAFWTQSAFKIVTVNSGSDFPCQRLHKKADTLAGR